FNLLSLVEKAFLRLTFSSYTRQHQNPRPATTIVPKKPAPVAQNQRYLTLSAQSPAPWHCAHAGSPPLPQQPAQFSSTPSRALPSPPAPHCPTHRPPFP